MKGLLLSIVLPAVVLSRLAFGATPPAAADLVDGVGPLVADFNEAVAMPRFITVLSPTCPACKLGADVMRDVVLSRKDGPDFRVFVIWAPMRPGDDETALRKSAASYGDHRTRNYLDPRRRVGHALRDGLFPNKREAMLGALPADHFFRGYAERMSQGKPEWDIYLAFAPGARWDQGPPTPAAWVRQVARYPAEADGAYESLMFVNDYGALPVEGSLTEQIKRMASVVLRAP